MLQVKPILTFREGRVEQFEKERTHRRALARLKELVYTQVRHNSQSYLTIMHAWVPEQALVLADELATQLGIDTPPILDLPPAITTHGGPGLLGVGFFVENSQRPVE
jgi:fatty acid-binding protein DegV